MRFECVVAALELMQLRLAREPPRIRTMVYFIGDRMLAIIPAITRLPPVRHTNASHSARAIASAPIPAVNVPASATNNVPRDGALSVRGSGFGLMG